MILYFDCNQSLDGRNAIADHLAKFGFQWMDMTGGQAAFEDGDLESFGNHIVEFARKVSTSFLVRGTFWGGAIT